MQPRLVLKATAARNGRCGSRRCWRPTQDRGFHFGNPDPSVSALHIVELRTDPDGSAHLGVRGRGENLDLTQLPLSPTVTVQLQASNGVCWSADYSSPNRSTADFFKARSDVVMPE
jgi:hypothetical protein